MVLLDEPFSALDAPVRAELRRELRRLQRDVNLSTVLVTHDPEEAAMLADEILVVSDGQVLQSGRCRDVYQRPASAADRPPARHRQPLRGRGRRYPASYRPVPPAPRLLWQVPPEALRVRPAPSRASGSAVDLGPGAVTDVVDLGRTVEVVVVLSSGVELRARSLDVPDLDVGAACRVETDPDAVSVWPITEIHGDGATLQPAPRETAL